MDIINLSNVKCPMNLVKLKQYFFEGKIHKGITIEFANVESAINAHKYLRLKNIHTSINKCKIHVLQ